MPFEIVRNDIVNMRVDAIVNSANPKPIVGLGTDSRIHEAAGPRLLETRKRIGNIAPGRAAITPAFDLSAKFVIHTVGPVWAGGSYGEEELLRKCYANSLELARTFGCKSIAFPLIATANYGFPKELALQIAVSAFTDFLMDAEMDIYLVVFEREAYRLSGTLFSQVASYIDQHYVDAVEKAVYGSPWEKRQQSMARRRADLELFVGGAGQEDCAKCPDMDMLAPCAAMPAPEAKAKTPKKELRRAAKKAVPGAATAPLSLEDLLRQEDAGFSETLLKLIDQSGKKDSYVYKRANLSKQHFSKIRNNPGYKPTKATALALAIALELNLEETRDLIGRAGYALTNSSKFDLIIRYFIERGIYDVVQINITLYEFDQNLLGA